MENAIVIDGLKKEYGKRAAVKHSPASSPWQAQYLCSCPSHMPPRMWAW